jgi:hypothetical protein
VTEKSMPPEVAAAILRGRGRRSDDTTLTEGITRGIAEALAPELKRLRERVAALEARPTVRYEGVWTADKAYGRGAMVTDGGQVWHCNEPNVGARPPGSQWTLAVKRGRDGKDIR